MKKLFFNDNILKVICLFFAIVFFIIVRVQNPDIEIVYKNIPLKYHGQGFPESGFAPVGDSNIMVEIAVIGKKKALESIDSSDITAWVDTSDITEAGEKTLEVQVSMPYDKAIITRKTPSAVTLTFDKLKVKTIPVELQVINKLGANYIVNSSVVEPSSIEIQGPSSTIDKIFKAVASVNLDKPEGIANEEAEYKYYDANGKQLTAAYVMSAQKTVKASVGVLLTKKVALTVDFKNYSDSWNDTLMNYSINPKEVTVSGSPSAIEVLNTIKIADIDLSKIAKSEEITYEIVLPTGITITNSIRYATVSINLDKLSTKNFDIKNFELQNLNEKFEGKVTNTSITVIARGDKNILDAINANELVGYVDMAGITGIGNYRLPVKVVRFTGKDLAIIGSYEVSVEVTNA